MTHSFPTRRSSDLNERGYRKVRRALARQYDIGWQEPDIQVVDVDMAGDRHLILEHNVMNGVLLAESDADQVLQHLADIWSYDVCLRSEEHTSELQSLMRTSYAVFCLKKKKKNTTQIIAYYIT